jgi:hypothetical protein
MRGDVDRTRHGGGDDDPFPGFAVPKGAPNSAAAIRFVESLVSEQAVVGISEALGTAPVNKAAKPNLSANAKKVEVFGPANTSGKTVAQDVEWYAKNFDQATTKLNNWLVGMSARRPQGVDPSGTFRRGLDAGLILGGICRTDSAGAPDQRRTSAG